MRDLRKPLPPGTRLSFESGSIYEISGPPIGCGGGSIIYPALRYSGRGGNSSDGFNYVLKECFPFSSACSFVRDDSGCIVPEGGDPKAEAYLRLCKDRQLREETITKKLYKTAIHTLPIKEASQKALCTLPGGEEHTVGNVYTVMDSLSLKGNALDSYVKNRRGVPLRQAFSVVRQLLCALREIHNAGFLHLDIQTGNIYLQGSIDGNESILTLIDFGSARPIHNGQTDMITDRLLFTTQGFAAPEIILHNDGSLILGPEADIYSAGCVLLTLLTGKRYESSELISNKTGRYIDSLKLRQIDCPKHLTEKMQHILARALKKDPRYRYCTAEEMLEDVDDFINALPNRISPIENTAFDAFISYRHGDIDSPAALELQKSLEHFRAPRGAAVEKHPFKRCYVDEGELSGGYDYARQLRQVLKNSRWLIVVCSPGTGNSRWVNEEIDIFLEYHDRSRVLALLTAGEPEQSFPARLLQETPQGDMLIAADARGRNLNEILKNIRGDALLRLAAPMLSTTFDGLRQREKAYRFRRTTAAATAAAIFALSIGSSIYFYLNSKHDQVPKNTGDAVTNIEDAPEKSVADTQFVVPAPDNEYGESEENHSVEITPAPAEELQPTTELPKLTDEEKLEKALAFLDNYESRLKSKRQKLELGGGLTVCTVDGEIYQIDNYFSDLGGNGDEENKYTVSCYYDGGVPVAANIYKNLNAKASKKANAYRVYFYDGEIVMYRDKDNKKHFESPYLLENVYSEAELLYSTAINSLRNR